jgi:membrane peptidoglycan carboxypeptidase
VWVGNDDRTPTSGITGGALPAQVWRQFVTAAAPLVSRTKEPPAIRAPETPPVTALSQCDQAACAARYNSFRTSDCTYQPYSGPRRLCALPPADQAAPAAKDVGGRTAQALSDDSQPDEDDRQSSHSRRLTGEMSLGGPGPSAKPERVYGETPRRPFGPSFFRGLDQRGGN